MGLCGTRPGKQAGERGLHVPPTVQAPWGTSLSTKSATVSEAGPGPARKGGRMNDQHQRSAVTVRPGTPLPTHIPLRCHFVALRVVGWHLHSCCSLIPAGGSKTQQMPVGKVETSLGERRLLADLKFSFLTLPWNRKQRYSSD